MVEFEFGVSLFVEDGKPEYLEKTVRAGMRATTKATHILHLRPE